MTPELRKLTTLINALAKEATNKYIAYCQALAAAADVVEKHNRSSTGAYLSLKDWAQTHINTPDGSLWTISKLRRYVAIGRNPSVYVIDKEDNKKRSAAYYAKMQGALQNSRAASTGTTQRASANQIQHQIEALMFAWRCACPEARKQFMTKVAWAVEDVA